jgi:ABC-type transport system involved in multi-copper enzyme maturation permease subunit
VNSIIYELQRTFRSRFVLVMVVLILLASSLVAYAVATQSPSVSPIRRVIDIVSLSGLLGDIFGIAIPILAVFMAYLTYGKDKTGGVLESVLARPVTRGGLLMSRFLGNTIAILIAVAASILIFDAGVYSYYAKGLPLGNIAGLIWTYLVEGSAFIGMVYLFSQLMRSQTAVLGISIALFLVFVLFWNTITSIVLLEVFHEGLASLASLQGTVISDFISPAGYGRNVTLYLGKQFTGLSTAGTIENISVDPASYGVTLGTLLAGGVAWMVLPIVGAYFSARKFD